MSASADKKQRIRSVPLHLLYTAEERAEIDAACRRHHRLARELVLEAIRAYRTLPDRVRSIEERVRAIEQGQGQATRKEEDEMVKARTAMATRRTKVRKLTPTKKAARRSAERPNVTRKVPQGGPAEDPGASTSTPTTAEPAQPGPPDRPGDPRERYVERVRRALLIDDADGLNKQDYALALQDLGSEVDGMLDAAREDLGESTTADEGVGTRAEEGDGEGGPGGSRERQEDVDEDDDDEDDEEDPRDGRET